MNRLVRLGRETVWSAISALQNRPQNIVPLAGMTLDDDDLGIATHWLRHRDKWNDESVTSLFEKEFARWNDSRFAFALAAGRKALSACIYALGLGPGDEVIVPGYTCVVVQNAFAYAGISIVHCDIELETYGPELASVTSCVSSRTRCVLIQHLYGLVCRDYAGIVAFAHSLGLKVIEDCAHSTGAMFRGRRVGNLGDVAFYSCERSKVFTTVVGGVASTNDSKIAERLRKYVSESAWPRRDLVEGQLQTTIIEFLRAKRPRSLWALPLAHFRLVGEETVSTSDIEIVGGMPADYHTRMPPPAADLALNQLKKVDGYNLIRRKTAKMWDSWCERMGYRKPMIIDNSEPVFLRYPVLVDAKRKTDTLWATQELGVTLGIWFKTHLHPSTMPVRNCPNADIAVASCVNLPCLLGGQNSIPPALRCVSDVEPGWEQEPARGR